MPDVLSCQCICLLQQSLDTLIKIALSMCRLLDRVCQRTARLSHQPIMGIGSRTSSANACPCMAIMSIPQMCCNPKLIEHVAACRVHMLPWNTFSTIAAMPFILHLLISCNGACSRCGGARSSVPAPPAYIMVSLSCEDSVHLGITIVKASHRSAGGRIRHMSRALLTTGAREESLSIQHTWAA